MNVRGYQLCLTKVYCCNYTKRQFSENVLKGNVIYLYFTVWIIQKYCYYSSNVVYEYFEINIADMAAKLTKLGCISWSLKKRADSLPKDTVIFTQTV